MKPSFLFAVLVLSAAPALGADSCHLAIAASINGNDSLREILGELEPSDVVVAEGDKADMIGSGQRDGTSLMKALRIPGAVAYLSGFHLIYVALPKADGTCEILAVGQGD